MIGFLRMFVVVDAKADDVLPRPDDRGKNGTVSDRNGCLACGFRCLCDLFQKLRILIRSTDQFIHVPEPETELLRKISAVSAVHGYQYLLLAGNIYSIKTHN